jgi:hypothetical protein
MAPFALCMALSDQIMKLGSPHPALSFLLDNATSGLRRIEGNHWREFERLVAYYLCLKTEVFHGDLVNLKTFLYGADVSDHARRIVQIHTRGYNESDNCIEPKRGNQPPQNCITLNGNGAEAGDILCCFDEPKGFTLRVACRHRQANLNQKAFDNELKKAFLDFNTSNCFMMCVTGPTNFVVRHDHARSLGLVYEKNFGDFFGPFVGRAFRETYDPSRSFPPPDVEVESSLFPDNFVINVTNALVTSLKRKRNNGSSKEEKEKISRN